MEVSMASALQQLADTGVALWLDDLSRARIQSGELARLVEHRGVVGITTNPTIFAKAIGSGAGYQAQIRDLALSASIAAAGPCTKDLIVCLRRADE
jgi:transaldolase